MAEGAAAAQAKERRREQMRRWALSAAGQGQVPSLAEAPSRCGRSVRFPRSAQFLAACAGGDLSEARTMLQAAGENDRVVDSTNADGISALHQACIDENLEVVEFLVDHGANVNQADNEGWTPLHVAASCSYLEIAEYLLKHGANIAAVNCDGDVPLDISEDDCMENLLQEEIAKQGIDVTAAKREEEEAMLQDARQWLNAGRIEEVRHPRTGAGALHVAAAKGYIEIMRLLLQAGYDPNSRDKDGWTPLHAAAHWGVEEACRILVENLCDMTALSNAGQRPCDVADEDVLNLLEELQKKQEDLRSEKEANLKQAVIVTCMEQQPLYTSKHRRSSVCRMSSKEKISVQDQSKEKTMLGTISIGAEESSSESEEEVQDSSEFQKKDTGHDGSGTLNGVTDRSPVSAVSPLPSVQKFTGGSGRSLERDDSSPAPWKVGLRKTGSFGVLQDAKMGEAKEAGVKRSASSPRLDLEDKNKEPRLARVPPTPSRRICSPLETEAHGKDRHDPSRSSEGGLRMKIDPVPSAVTSPPATTTTTSSTTTGNTDLWDLRRSYQAPVRDEESESQRKARSRLMRQSRRSTQGVTLTDLKEAERTLGRSVIPSAASESKAKVDDQREKKEGELSSERQDLTKGSQASSGESPSSPSSLQTVNTQGRTAPEAEGVVGEEKASDNRERRKTNRGRWAGSGLQNASQGDENSEDVEPVNSEDALEHGVSGYVNSLAVPNKTGRHNCTVDSSDEVEATFKELYQDLLSENETLKEQLQEAELRLTQVKLELERVTQQQERHMERPALLELERFERRTLERKAAEMEEELKVLSDLKADNQRLKDENAALIRVISKLSK
ncbi:protein phosphatase 1 regulatory subunit 12C isoform X1 [Microcaecilia unicolor]|uniref:Protein phosphatase 1 regulatory subunit n=1 Tax=Microcaecilia unicolor TaxID=1415580 RepID=A0A6P7XDW3_9AMPH|nr:protein phosphatase 1 regulatory subunit 12C isoform X1 [Microcaecilia unicolor]